MASSRPEDVAEFNRDFPALYRHTRERLIVHLRDAKRYANALSMNLPLAAGEVNLQDFCLLEFTRVFFPKVYDDVFDNWWYYVDQRFEDDLESPFLITLSDNSNQTRERRRTHIEDMAAKFVDNQEEKEIVLVMLRELFPKVLKGPLSFDVVRDEERKRRIWTAAFSKYSTFRAPASGVEHGYIQAVLLEAHNSSRPYEYVRNILLELRDKKKLAAFLRELRLFTQELKAGNLNRVIAIVIYENIGRLSAVNRGLRSLYSSEYDRAVQLFLQLLQDMPPDVRSDQLRRAISKTPDWFFAIHVLQQSAEDITHPSTISELELILRSRLANRLIDKAKNIFTDVPNPCDAFTVLYAWGSWNSDREADKVRKYLLERLDDPKVLLDFARCMGAPTEEGPQDLNTLQQNLAAWNKLVSLEELDRITLEHLGGNKLDSNDRGLVERFRRVAGFDSNSTTDPDSDLDPTARS